MLSVVMLSVVIMLSAIIMHSVVIMLSSIIMLSAVMPNVCTAFQTEPRRPVGRRTRRCRPFDEDEPLLGTILIKLLSAVIYSLAIKINI